MANATSPAKRKTSNDQSKAAQLRFTLEATDTFEQEIADARKKTGGVSDLDVRLIIARAFEANGMTEGRVVSDDGAAYFAVDAGRTPLFWFDTDPADLDRPRRKPSAKSPQLVALVRGLYGLQAPARKSTGKKTAAAKELADVDQEVGDVRLIDPRLVDPTPGQPREMFDIDGLAKSIDDHGQTAPAVVREIGERFEVIAGERRLRACLKLGRPLLARVVALDDNAAAEMAARDNLEADPLKPMEVARAYRTAIDAGGYSQRDLAAKLNVDQGTVSHYLGMLKLPAKAQALINSGRLGVYHARALVPFGNAEKYPAELLEMAVRDLLDRIGKTVTIEGWHVNKAIRDALDVLSRPLSGRYRTKPGLYDFTAVELTAADRKKHAAELAPVKLPADAGGDEVTFNLAKFDELQAAGIERRKLREAKRGAKAAGKTTDAKALSAAEQKAKAKAAAEKFQKRLYLWKVRELQELIGKRLATSPGSPKTLCGDPWLIVRLLLYFTATGRSPDKRDALLRSLGKRGPGASSREFVGISAGNSGKLWDALEKTAEPEELAIAAVSAWLAEDVTSWATAVDPQQVESVAATLSIDLAGDAWTLGRPFLELHTKSQLAKLVAEWKLAEIDAGSAKRGELIDAILTANEATPLPAPKEVAAVKMPAGGIR